MTIDWFTVAAQMINFLILVWLLKRFLYGPLLRTMEERRRQVEDHLARIEADRRNAETVRQALAAETAAFERAREERLRTAAEEFDERRKQLTEELRLEIDTLRRRWQGSLAQEQESFRANLSALAERELLELAGKIVTDLADVRLESLMAEKFLQRLRDEQDNPAPDGIFALLGRTPGLGVRICSSFPLPPETRTRIAEEVNRNLHGGRKVEFQVIAGIGCGIELHVDHHKLSWTVAEYVASFQATMEAAVRQKADAAH